ncbi:myb/SANT-like DNA-binding domain-containing protein 7 [Saccostrea cucullata]|uniref:myb/SANT-like DNA-binding domain-containing protein 7 n=1 Tax=Saccostrea cuccullata TaxID=36930 RepID=UPI002ED2F99D
MAKETRGINWNSEEIIELIESWASEEISNDFSGVYRNKHVYEKIAIALRGKGIDRTWESCRTKIKGLRQAYLRAKLHNNTSGQSRSRFVYFDKLDEFLGSKPLTEPSVLVDTTENVEEKVAVEINNGETE